MTQSTALASLTAIYTDSEGEEEEESNENAGEGTLTSTQVTPENRVSPASVASPVQVKITSKVIQFYFTYNVVKIFNDFI